ncbi:MAG: type II toxin-antitoxin system VapC family toxin [Actinomycetota bacterium]
MALVYFDSSALVKLLVQERGSELAAELWDRCDAATSSRLAEAEVPAALAAANRNHVLTDDALRHARQGWERIWASARPAELTPEVSSAAGALAVEHPLSGADAVHLASALAVQDAGVIVAVWDRRLHAGCEATGLAVAPADLDAVP